MSVGVRCRYHGNQTQEKRVSVPSGCYNTGPQTEWRVNIKHLFLRVLEAEKSKMKGAADSVSAESLLSGSRMAIFSVYLPMGGRAETLAGVSYTKAQIPFMRTWPS